VNVDCVLAVISQEEEEAQENKQMMRDANQLMTSLNCCDFELLHRC